MTQFPDNDLPDLDDLLGVAMAKATADKADKAMAKQRAALSVGKGYLSLEDLARLRAWELAHDWTAEANVALFIQHQCHCGTYNNTFEGLFVKERHRRIPETFQHRRVDSALARLPNETAIQVRECDMCGDCAEGKGWNVDEPATIWAGPGEEVVVTTEQDADDSNPDAQDKELQADEELPEAVSTFDDSEAEPELEE